MKETKDKLKPVRELVQKFINMEKRDRFKFCVNVKN